MSFFVPEPTPYDVNFRLYGFPVRVHPAFWLVHAAIAAFLASDNAITAEVWPPLVFLLSFVCTSGSILIHEMGHVLAGRKFGADGEIVLTFCGGLAGTEIEAHTHRDRILVFLAGPAANLLVVAVAAVGWELLRPSQEEMALEILAYADGSLPARTLGHSVLELIVLLLLSVNAPLALWNLLPIPPLDGGKIAQELLAWVGGDTRPGWERNPDWWKRG